MTYGYTHGWGDCQRCFTGADMISLPKNWQLHNNPGYAGSPTPRILLLGFSKGASQLHAAQGGEYDQVPFARMRSRLEKVLRTLELMPSDRSIDQIFTANEQVFGTASLVRCSLCRMREKECITSGALVTDGFRVVEIKTVIERCAATYLLNLPSSLKGVILLGSNLVYIEKTMQLFKSLHPDFEPVNEMAFRARGILWLYAAHPSRASTSLDDWTDGRPDNPAGLKLLRAKAALARYPLD